MNSQGSLELLSKEKMKIGSRACPLGDITKEMTKSKANNGVLTDYADELAETYAQKGDLNENSLEFHHGRGGLHRHLIF